MEEFSFKELYDVSLKATYPFDYCNRHFEAGETIAIFDKLSIANLNEIKSNVSAKGGFNNANLVTWESTKEVRINFSQGVFSKLQFALLNNSKMLQAGSANKICVSKRENVNSDEKSEIHLKYSPKNIHIYDEEFKKLNYNQVNENTFYIYEPFKKVIVDYTFEYENSGKIMKLGQQLISGYLELEGKTRYKDDESGQVKTGIIKIPRLKLMSELSIRLGEYASPVVGNFSGVGYPVGARGNQTVMEMYFLEDDIDSDI